MAVHNNVGSFLATTNVWDVTEVNALEKESPALKELLIRLYQNLNQSSININLKDTGYYTTSEFVNGQSFFPNPGLTSASSTTPTMRQVYRCVINFGALPNTTTKSVPHHLTFNPGFSMTRLYGSASKSDATSFIPLPYASTTAVANNIELSVTGTNVVIKTGIDYSAYTTTYVVLEYLKS